MAWKTPAVMSSVVSAGGAGTQAASPVRHAPIETAHDFRECFDNFGYALAKQFKAGQDIAAMRPQVAELRRQMDEIEAEIINNGGYDTIVIDGKNAEARASQLKLACEKHQAYVTLRAARADLERDIDLAQNEERDADNTMRRCRLWAEQYTAETYREAARMPLKEGHR